MSALMFGLLRILFFNFFALLTLFYFFTFAGNTDSRCFLTNNSFLAAVVPVLRIPTSVTLTSLDTAFAQRLLELRRYSIVKSYCLSLYAQFKSLPIGRSCLSNRCSEESFVSA